ncbi:5621_t:CDS:1, partial [Acaulospora colombiana]
DIATYDLSNTTPNDSADAKIDGSGDVVMVGFPDEEIAKSLEVISKVDSVDGTANGLNGVEAKGSLDKPTDNSKVISRNNCMNASRDGLIDRRTTNGEPINDLRAATLKSNSANGLINKSDSEVLVDKLMNANISDSSSVKKNGSTDEVGQNSSVRSTDDLNMPRDGSVDTAMGGPKKTVIENPCDKPTDYLKASSKDSLSEGMEGSSSVKTDESNIKKPSGAGDLGGRLTEGSENVTAVLDDSVGRTNSEDTLKSNSEDVTIKDESMCESASAEVFRGRRRKVGGVDSGSSGIVRRDASLGQDQKREEKDVSDNLVEVDDSGANLVRQNAEHETDKGASSIRDSIQPISPEGDYLRDKESVGARVQKIPQNSSIKSAIPAGITFIDLTSDDEEKDDIITVMSWSSMDANIDEDDPPSLAELAVFDEILAEADDEPEDEGCPSDEDAERNKDDKGVRKGEDVEEGGFKINDLIKGMNAGTMIKLIDRIMPLSKGKRHLYSRKSASS